MKCQTVLLALFFLTALPVFLLSARNVFGQSSSRINATVKISICGNEVKEGGEECDRDDLGGASCRSLGFDTGDLTCDIACDYEKAECTGVAPLPPPSPTPTPAPTSNSTSASTPTPTPFSSPTSTDGALVTNSPVPSINPTSSLPFFLQIFDLTGTGKITENILAEVMQLWVDEWKNDDSSGERKKCDVNNDSQCSLEDFSILLFYVER